MKFKVVISVSRQDNKSFTFSVDAEKPVEAIMPALMRLYRRKALSCRPHGFHTNWSSSDARFTQFIGYTTITDKYGTHTIDRCSIYVYFPTDEELGISTELVGTLCELCDCVESYQIADGLLVAKLSNGGTMKAPSLRLAVSALSILFGDESMWETIERAKSVA